MFEKKQEQPQQVPENVLEELELKKEGTPCLPTALLVGALVVLGIILIRHARVPDNKTIIHLVYYGGCWNPAHEIAEQMAHFVGDAVK